MMEPKSVESICDELRQGPSGGISPERLSGILSMTQAELARLIGVAEAELGAAPGAPDIQCKLEPIAMIVARASMMSRSVSKAVAWFRDSPLPPFGGKRAIDVVAEGRSVKILEWLDALEDGAYG